MRLHHPRTLVAVLAALALAVPVGGAMAHEDGDETESENGPLEVEARPSIVPVGNRVFVEAEYEVDGEADDEDGDEGDDEADDEGDDEADDEGDDEDGDERDDEGDEEDDEVEEDDSESDEADDDTESDDDTDEADDVGAQQTAGLPTTVTFSVDWGTGAQPETMTVTEEDAHEDEFQSEAIASRPMEEAGAFPVTVTATPDVGKSVSTSVTVQVGRCSAGLEGHDEPSEDGVEDGEDGEADHDEVARCVYDSLPDIVGDAHAASVVAVFSNGIVQGKADGTFGPHEPVTRAQMATFLARALDLWASEDAELPDDVDAGNPHADAIAAVIEEAIALGKADGSFEPNEPVSRGQMASFLDRAFALVEHAGGDLPEDAEGTVHERAIEAVTDNGIAQGFADGTFRPGDTVTRGQMATFLTRALDL